MKVSELIKLLQDCEPDANVEFAYVTDATTCGTDISSVVQITYFEYEEYGREFKVQLRAN